MYKKQRFHVNRREKFEFVLDDKGRRIKSQRTQVTLPEKWVGYCLESQKAYTLTNKFVEKNIPRDFESKSRFWGLPENTSTSRFRLEKTKNMVTFQNLLKMLQTLTTNSKTGKELV